MMPCFQSHRGLRFALAAMLLAAGVVLRLDASDARGYGVFKSVDYVQTSTNPPVLLSDFPFSFAAIAQPVGVYSNQITRVTVESPLGFVDPLLAPATGTDQPFAFGFGAGSQAELDAYYPTGTYTLRISAARDGERVIRLPLPTNSFPAAPPRVSNYPAAQSIDPTLSFALGWDPFIGGTTNDFISLSIVDRNNRVVFRSAAFAEEPGLTLLSGTNTSVMIPAGTLGRGETYYGYLYFEKDVVNQSTNYPGARGLVGFSRATSFSLQTSTLAFRLESLGVNGTQFAVRWQGGPGRTYILQSSTDLGSTNWTSVSTNVGTGGSITLTNVMTTTLGAHLFRLLMLP